jgi:hypothetical protein
MMRDSARSLRECGYVMWDDEIPVSTKELRKKVDKIRTKPPSFPWRSYQGEKWRRSQD